MRRHVPGIAAVVVAVGIATLAGGAQAAGNPLTGEAWQLDRLAGVDRSSLAITARFSTAGKVSGFSGCDQYSGTYTISGSTIAISKLTSTRMACRRLVMLRE